MDFHTLTRKELQFLCKKNKIPANITNVAMADALTAFENVAGLDEFIKQSQSPEEIARESESPLITRSVNRTSTRRKPINEDPETAQPLTRNRLRKINKNLDQENNNLTMPESPAVSARRTAPTIKKMNNQKQENVEHEISNIFGTTPAVQTNRRTQVSLARRKVADGSVLRVYGTRQSVRLLEKTTANLILTDEGRAEPVKMNDLDETKEKDVSAAKTNDTKVSSSIESLENKEEMEDVQQKNKSDNSVDDQEANCLDNHLLEVNAKDDVPNETSDNMLSDKSNRSNTDEMESVPVLVTEFPSEIENAFAKVVEQKHCLIDTDEISARVMEAEVPDLVDAYQKDFIRFGEQLKSKNDSELLIDLKNTESADELPSDTKVVDDSGSHKSVGDQLDTTADECVGEEIIIVENEIDEELIEAEVPICNEDETPEIVKQISHSSALASEEKIPLSTLAVDSISDGKNPTPGKHSVSGVKFTRGNPTSPLGADPLPMHFPQPTQSTPLSKKKQATNEKKILAVDNKENIDRSGMKVGSKMDKVKKNKNIVEEDMMPKSPLEDKSLRQLTKMLKEKLQLNGINNKINDEEENTVKRLQVGKTRPALQTLPENLLLIPGEPKLFMA